MSSLRPFVSIAFVALLAAAARAQSGCTVNGITTSDFGSSCGQLALTFDASSCQLVATITPGSAMSIDFLLVGMEQSVPLDLPSPPFPAGCKLLVAGAPIPLVDHAITVPPIPQLVGQSVDLQGVSLSIQIPPTIPPTSLFNLTTTQGVHLTFN